MSTVLIAAAASLGPMKQRGEFQDALAFADTDALRALEAITRLRPAVVVLENTFAATSRGTALINRIKADPSLTACEVRIVTNPLDGGPGLTEVVTAPAAAARPAAPPPTLDPAGTRAAPRFELVGAVEVLVDGNAAALVDLSTTGAQVMSSGTLKPNQRVRLTLPGSPAPITVSGAITWAMFEMPQTGPCYRAGVEFFDPDTEGIARFIESKKK